MIEWCVCMCMNAIAYISSEQAAFWDLLNLEPLSKISFAGLIQGRGFCPRLHEHLPWGHSKSPLHTNKNNPAVEIVLMKGHFCRTGEDTDSYPGTRSSIMEESLKMKFFDHLNVLTLVGMCVDSGPAPYILMPFVSHGSLLSYLKKERHNLTVNEDSNQEELVSSVQKQLLSVCLQVAQRIGYLYSITKICASRPCSEKLHVRFLPLDSVTNNESITKYI